MPTSQAEKLLLGEAGEFLVLTRLLRHGHVASQAPRNWKADDILIHGGQSIQLKTTDALCASTAEALSVSSVCCGSRTGSAEGKGNGWPS